jgi:hypothetical protein
MRRSKITGRAGLLLLGALALAGCENSGSTRAYTGTINNPGGPKATEAYRPTGQRSDFVQGSETAQRAATVQVNRFAWRASLDTVSFMPLVSADPFGGVIITDWYSPPQSPEERFKVNVYILGRALRADGIRASVFRQQRDGVAGWLDAPVAANTATDMENAILTRARQMRVAQLGE